MASLSLRKHAKQEQYHQTLQQQLVEAAIQGSVPILSQILQENPQFLQPSNFSTSKNPLHIAALRGHLEFTKQLLTINPSLSKSLNSEGSSALHLASAKGNVEIVRELVLLDNSMCRVLNGGGFSPLHLAAMNGRTEVLGVLLDAEPQAATALTRGGESCLQLCVKCYQFEAMKVVIQFLKRVDDDRIIHLKDKRGNSVLHFAVVNKHVETVKYLVDNTTIARDARNANGLTALDLLLQSPADLRISEIKQCLEQNNHFTPAMVNSNFSRTNNRTLPLPKTQYQHDDDWLARQPNVLTIVASILAYAAFKGVLSPPGGVWKSDFAGNPNGTTWADKPHKAGQSIMAYTNPSSFNQFMILNTIVFLASLTVILLQLGGLPMRGRRWMLTRRMILLVAITALVLTSYVTMLSTTPEHVLENSVYRRVGNVCVAVSLLLSGAAFVGNVAAFMGKMEGGVYEEDGEDDDD
ncbi:hypothetical protein CASFOL_010138 [Castilleja foliolosa]|uniref:PGG domain-containing protein n=1 Tax=Castilleja foliolosa TaxID=1961234 RepID=A0ABD3DS95_9LAMI